ncbi:MAG: hypothetical protein ACAH10_15005 [Methylophilaceae bacterium]
MSLTASADRDITPVPPGSKLILISLLGDQLHLHHIGFSIFSNVKRDVDISTWGIDNFTENQAKQLIDKNHKFTSVTAGKEYRDKFGLMEISKWNGTVSYKNQADGINALTEKETCDLIVLIKPAFNGVAFPNQQFLVYYGNGIYQDASFKEQGTAVNFSMIEILILDPKTRKVLSSVSDYESSTRSTDVWMSDKSLTFDTYNEASTKTQVLALIKELLVKEFTKLQLIN